MTGISAIVALATWGEQKRACQDWKGGARTWCTMEYRAGIRHG